MQLCDNKPTFSVVIPTYNRGELLRDAIESVLFQTDQDFEIIVVNDASTDNTNEVLYTFTDKRIKKIEIEKSGIVATVRNIGIKESKGSLIAFLDSDDLWYPKKLQKVREVFEKDEKIVLVCHDMLLTRQGKFVFIHRYGPFENNMYERLLFRGNCIGSSATVVRRKAIEKIGLFVEDKNFLGAEDYECWLRLSKIGYFYFLSEILGEYRILRNNISRNIDKITECRINVINYHYSKVFEKHTRRSDRLIKARRSDIFARSARTLQIEGRFKEARRLYLKSIKENPGLLTNYIGWFSCLLGFRLKTIAGIHLFLLKKSVRY